jgi:hypothetical protein
MRFLEGLAALLIGAIGTNIFLHGWHSMPPTVSGQELAYRCKGADASVNPAGRGANPNALFSMRVTCAEGSASLVIYPPVVCGWFPTVGREFRDLAIGKDALPLRELRGTGRDGSRRRSRQSDWIWDDYFHEQAGPTDLRRWQGFAGVPAQGRGHLGA